jgi:hypothetical protein
VKSKRLLVIGGGPKAVALCAKAYVLKQLKLNPPEIIVFEKKAVGAHWNGSLGYTDGWQFVCTPAEKDVGFPYNSLWGSFGYDVDRPMLEFSWQSFMVHSGSFSEWVDRGRHPPRHRTFWEYLCWVANKINLQIVSQNVKKVDIKGTVWSIERPRSESPRVIEGDGLVITGPGQPKAIPHQPRHPFILNGRTVWKHLDQFTELKRGRIGIIGSGESSAAIVMALLPRIGPRAEIIIMNRDPIIYSRGESYDENKYFSNSADWLSIPPHDRNKLIERTDRGVFSAAAKRILDRATNVRHEPINVNSIDIWNGHPQVIGTYGTERKKLRFDRLIVAISFDALSTLRVLPRELRNKLVDQESEQKIGEHLAWDLSVPDVKPRLHLPMLATLPQGPGLPNLTSLGELSDRILFDYVD